MQNFGIKSYNSLALKKAANWLVNKYQSFGYLDVVKDSFTYNSNQLYNIVVTKQGTIFPNKYLIIN
ncbi:MAG: leucyl aminopeptidase, partial [Candidatus Omnitrophota bacterium]